LMKISQTLFRKPNFIWSVFKHIGDNRLK